MHLFDKFELTQLAMTAYDSVWICRGIADPTLLQIGTYRIVERRQLPGYRHHKEYLKRIF